ncbi:MAG: pyridoxal phosphate-dependent aminotransferase [Caldimicrobium sp.]
MKNKPLHGGNIFFYASKLCLSPVEIIDLSSSVNPLLYDYLKDKGLDLYKYLEYYPDPECTELKKLLEKIHSLDWKYFLIGNGSFELIQAFLQFILPKNTTVLLLEPTFIGYRYILSKRKDIKIETFIHLEVKEHLNYIEKFLKNNTSPKVVLLCNPQNPTGAVYFKSDLISLLLNTSNSSKTYFLVDEAFIDFKEEESLIKEVKNFPNLFVFRSLTKFYGMAGLRLGYIAGNKNILNKLKNFLPTWNVNTLAQFLAKFLLLDEYFKKNILEYFLKEKETFEEKLRTLGVKFWPSVANYYLLYLRKGEEFYNWLLKEKGILVRSCYNFTGLDANYIRVSLKRKEENLKFLFALEEWCKLF